MSDLVGNPEDRFSHVTAQFLVSPPCGQGASYTMRSVQFRNAAITKMNTKLYIYGTYISLDRYQN